MLPTHLKLVEVVSITISNIGEIATNQGSMVSEDNTVVLLFDSGDTSANLISKCFSIIDVPHQMRRVTNPDAMINYLKESDNKDNSEQFIRPRLIVIHVNTFDNEIETLLEYVKNDPDLKRVPLILLSESADSQSIQTAYRLKTNSYIVCPESPLEIEKVMCEVASYWLKWNQLPP